MRYPATLTVPIDLCRDGRQPLWRQIAGQLGTAVDEGRLAAGSALPATRTLAELLRVSRGVVAAAYDQLAARGYLEGRPGSGSYVVGPPPPAAPAPADAEPPLVDLRPGGPAPDVFPVRAWRAAWRRASFRPPPTRPPPPLGLPELRRAVAAHLRETRGAVLAGSEVVVTGGTTSGVRLVLDALALAGADVAVEEPAPLALRRAVPGGAPARLPVDPAGARVGAVPPGCRAVVVSPSAHEPLGHIMSAARRRQAAEWVAGTGGWLVEVACDAVLRPLACRLPQLPALAGGATVVVGGFAAVLGPGLGLGYLLAPAALAGPVARLIAGRGGQPSDPVQRAVAELLGDGTVLRLMHRLEQAYRCKRQLVEGALRPLVRLGGRGAVGSVVLYLPDGQDGARATGWLRQRGIRVRPLAAYHASGSPPAPARSGLVVGYGHLPDPALRSGVARLARELTGLGQAGWALPG